MGRVAGPLAGLVIANGSIWLQGIALGGGVNFKSDKRELFLTEVGGAIGACMAEEGVSRLEPVESVDEANRLLSSALKAVRP